MYKTKTEHTLNSHKDAVDKIIYINADLTTTEVTLDAFLKEDKRHTEEQFRKLKAESDENYRLQDEAARERARNELELFDWSDSAISKSKWTGSFLSKTVEEQCFGNGEDEAHELYLARRSQAITLLPGALKVLTEIQMRRLVMHKVEGYTTRKIAEIEGVTQQSVHESITGAEKKIAKFLRKKWTS